MIQRLYFKEYGDPGWQEWTQYLAGKPSLPQGVESDEEGEAGLITYDSVNISLYNSPGNAVNDAFETNWTSSKKYLFRIDIADDLGNFSTKHVGLADFLTLDFPNLSSLVNFEITDRLSSLEVLESGTGRQQNVNIFERSGAQAYLDAEDWTAADGYLQQGSLVDGEIVFNMYIEYLTPGSGSRFNYQPPLNTVLPGEVIPFKGSYYLVKSRSLQTVGGEQNERDVLQIVTVATEESDDQELIFHESYNIYEKNYYGIDINVVTGDVLQKFDGFELIKGLVQNTWSEITLVNQTGTPIYDIALQLYNDLITVNPFGKEPPEAIKYLADSIHSYIYIDEEDQLIISKRSELGSIGTLRSIGTTDIKSGSWQPIWDKLADAVEVTVTSGIMVDGELLTSTVEVRKNPNLKPRNPIRKEILLTDNSVNDQESLDAYAASIAQLYLDFYGYRHEAYPLELDLDSNTNQWKLLDRVQLSGKIYFIVKLVYGPGSSIHIYFVSLASYDYDAKSVLMPKNDDVTLANSVTRLIKSQAINITGTYNFDPPLELNSKTVSIKNLSLDTDEVLAFRNATTPQEHRVYNTYTDDSNREFVSFGFKNNADVFTIESEAAGTGTVRDIAFMGASRFGFGTKNFDEDDPARVIIQGASNDGSDFIFAGRDSDGVNVATLDTDGKLTVQDLVVMGTEFIANVETVEIEDNLLVINNGEPGAGVTAGIAGLQTDRGTLPPYQNVFVEGSNTYRIGEVGDLQAVATREDNPTDGSIHYWNDTAFRFDTIDSFKWDGTRLNLDAAIGSSDYVSQLTGWNITEPGAADFRYLYTDELHAKAFIADLEQALAGSQIICKSVAKVAVDYAVPSAGNSSRLIVESFGGFETAAVYQNGDLIRLRQFSRSSGSLNISDAWGTVVLDIAYGSSGFNTTNKTQAYIFTRHSSVPGSASGTIEEGTLALDYGVSGNGFIEANAIDGMWAANSPYHQIVTWSTTPGNYTIHNRTGKLTGITDADFGGTLPADFGTYINGTAFIKGNIFVKATNALALQANSIMIGNITGTAANAIKMAQTGTTSTSGHFLYDSSANELLKFALNGSRHIANWNFDKDMFYKLSGSNKFALNTSATPYISANQTGFEVYDISDPKFFVGTKNASAQPQRGIDYNITTADEFTMRGTFSTRSTIGTDDGVYINDWHIYNRQLSGAISLESYLNPYQLRFAEDGIEKLRVGDINGLQVYGIKTNGNFTFNVDDIVPYLTYTSSIGAYNKKFLSMHVAEIIAETLVAQEVAATIGGRVVVGPSNILVRDCHVDDTFIEVKYNNYNNGDIIHFEGIGQSGTQTEWMQITSNVYVIDGKYRYNVTRNIDGTSINGWWAGDSCTSTGVAGNGWIDMYSVRSMKGASQYGPTIVGNIRNSSTWNDWSEVWAIGNLSNLYNQSGGTVGVGLGKYANGFNHLVITPSAGIRFFNYNTNISQWVGDTIRLGQVASGKQNLLISPDYISFYQNTTQVAKWEGSTITLGIVAAGQSNIFMDSGTIQLRNNTTPFVELSSAGVGKITGGIIQTSESPNNRVVLENNQLNFYVGATSKVSLYPYYDESYSQNTIYVDNAMRVGSIRLSNAQIFYEHPNPSVNDFWLADSNGFSAQIDGTDDVTFSGTNDAFSFTIQTNSQTAIMQFRNESDSNNVQLYYSDPETTVNEIALKSSKMFDCNYGYKIQGTTVIDSSGNASFNTISIGDSDADQDLIHVGVTGNPLFSWDESADVFKLNKGLNIENHILSSDDTTYLSLLSSVAGASGIVFHAATAGVLGGIRAVESSGTYTIGFIDENGSFGMRVRDGYISPNAGYKSVDGSTGGTFTFIDNNGNTITIKNGIAISKTLAS